MSFVLKFQNKEWFVILRIYENIAFYSTIYKAGIHLMIYL
jgi:hypothetical protein